MKKKKTATKRRARDDEWVTSAETAELLGVHRKSLDRMRLKGDGPRFTKRAGRIRYRRADVEKWLEPLQATKRFDEDVPAHLPAPEPVTNRRLSKYNAGIVRMMARAGAELCDCLDYLSIERSDLDADTMHQLRKDVARLRAQSRYEVGRSTISAALTSRQGADRQLADKLLKPTTELGGYAEAADNAVQRIEALMQKAKAHSRTP